MILATLKNVMLTRCLVLVCDILAAYSLNKESFKNSQLLQPYNNNKIDFWSIYLSFNNLRYNRLINFPIQKPISATTTGKGMRNIVFNLAYHWEN